MRGMALVPIFLIGLCAGVWLVVAPWVVGFPHGHQGGWGAGTWSSVWAGAIVVGASGVALVTTVAVALGEAFRRAEVTNPE